MRSGASTEIREGRREERQKEWTRSMQTVAYRGSSTQDRSRVKPRADEWTLREYSTRDLVGHVGDIRQICAESGDEDEMEGEASRRGRLISILFPSCWLCSPRLTNDLDLLFKIAVGVSCTSPW
jgi:hypothetical protein